MTGLLTVLPINLFCRWLGRQRTRGTIFLGVLATLLGTPPAAPVLAIDRIDLSGLAGVEGKQLPQHWQKLNFPSISGATSYQVVDDPVRGPVIRAQSSSGAGGIVRSISANPQQYPILNWSWKIEKTVDGSSLVDEGGDDFPVRVMISFKVEGRGGFKGLRDNVLCYVWASEDAIGTIAVNPIHRHIMTVVASSGNNQSGDWLDLSRNLAEDYKRAFSEEPGMITGVALMTDSDNTGTEALAWYGPVWLHGGRNPDPSPISK